MYTLSAFAAQKRCNAKKSRRILLENTLHKAGTVLRWSVVVLVGAVLIYMILLGMAVA